MIVYIREGKKPQSNGRLTRDLRLEERFELKQHVTTDFLGAQFPATQLTDLSI